MSDYDNIDISIITTIEEMRETHHACTARLVARRLRVSADVIRYRLQKMREEGTVTWTDVPGSLRVLSLPAVPAPAEQEEATEPEDAVTDEPSEAVDHEADE